MPILEDKRKVFLIGWEPKRSSLRSVLASAMASPASSSLRIGTTANAVPCRGFRMLREEIVDREKLNLRSTYSCRWMIGFLVLMVLACLGVHLLWGKVSDSVQRVGAIGDCDDSTIWSFLGVERVDFSYRKSILYSISHRIDKDFFFIYKSVLYIIFVSKMIYFNILK